VTSQDISISVINDSLAESSENIVLTLSNQVNAILGAYSVYTYTINDEDSPGITASPHQA
jgi:hypothetical protein